MGPLAAFLLVLGGGTLAAHSYARYRQKHTEPQSLGGGRLTAPATGVPRLLPQASPTPIGPPRLLQGDPMHVQPGRRYWATIVTHRAANIATETMVRNEADKRGFVQIQASSQKPADWPGHVEGDWYVSAIFNRAATTMPRSEGGFAGSAEVVEALESA